MKLYREVKGEEDHKHILFENGKGYVCDLEPIEITEEEINAYAYWQAQEYTDYEDEQADIRDNIRDGINWALSKLKGE